jgi:hypothetical protein
VSEILLEYELSSFEVCFFNRAGAFGLGGEGFWTYWLFKGGSTVEALLLLATLPTFLLMRRLFASGGSYFFSAEL